jgi:hypothetical protein
MPQTPTTPEIQIALLGEDATEQVGYLKEFIELQEIDGLTALEVQRAATTRGSLSYATFSNLKKVILSMILLSTMALVGQAQTFPALDKTPMDMVYYPDEYAHDRKFAPAKIGADKAMIRLTYNRPAKKEREIFGKLVPYGKVWRTGANEAPEIKFYQPVVTGAKRSRRAAMPCSPSQARKNGRSSSAQMWTSGGHTVTAKPWTWPG